MSDSDDGRLAAISVYGGEEAATWFDSHGEY